MLEIEEAGSKLRTGDGLHVAQERPEHTGSDTESGPHHTDLDDTKGRPGTARAEEGPARAISEGVAVKDRTPRGRKDRPLRRRSGRWWKKGEGVRS